MSRSERGTGSVYFVKSRKRWVGAKIVEGRRRTVSAKTGAEAERLLARIGRGPEAETVAEWLEQWMGLKERCIRSQTIRRYREFIAFLLPEFGSLKLRALHPLRVDEGFKNLLDAGRSKWDVKSGGRVFLAAMRKAHAYGMVPLDPTAGVELPVPERKELRILIEPEASALVLASRSHRHGGIVRLALWCGMRIGEILGLCWENVRGKKIHVQRTLRWDGGTPVFADVKSKAGRRLLPLPLDADIGTPRAAGPVFTTKNGRPISHSSFMRQVFQPMLERAGCRKINFHCLRHTCASILLSRGRSIRAVSGLLGHADPALTLRTYGHLMPNDLEVLIGCMTDVLTPPLPTDIS